MLAAQPLAGEQLAKRKPQPSQGRASQAAKRARAAHADGDSGDRENALIDAFLERDTRPLSQTEAPLDSKCASQQQQLVDAQPAAGGQRSARTFADITRQHSSRHALSERPPVDWTPPSLAPALLPDATNLTLVEAGGGERQLPPAAAPPLDWSLKTTLRISSPTPFAVCEEAATLPGAEAVEAQRAFCAGAGVGLLRLPQQASAALLSFQYPGGGAQPPRPELRALGTPTPALIRRRQAWQAAFCSLYDAYRAGRCDAFYYVSPGESRNPFVALFGAAGLAGRPRMHAILTRTTAGLRALLEGRLELGLATPLMREGGGGGAAAGDLSAPPAEGTQSMAVLEGTLRVHGLFDFLLNESFRTHGDECDVPTLLAPVPFVHAALVSAEPNPLSAPSAAPAGAAPQHRLLLRGLVPPWVVDRLACLLAVTQDGNFCMAADTHPLTLALNWLPGGGAGGGARPPLGSDAAGAGSAALWPAAGDDYAAQQRGCWDAEEAARWRAPAPGLACNVLRELRCEGGAFVGRLSARTAERAL
eukprot:scaffold9.g3308.t1